MAKKGASNGASQAAKVEREVLEREEENRQTVWAKATEFKARKVEWLWLNRISCAGLTFLDGDPGTGKSSLVCDLAARVSRGRTMPDGSKTQTGSVIMLLGEPDAYTETVPRLRAANANLAKVIIWGQKPGNEIRDLPRFPSSAASLADAIKQHKARLVVIDPYMSFLCAGLSPYNEQDVRLALGPVAQVAQQSGAAILLIRHPNKSTSQKKLYRGGGSLGITAIARTVLWSSDHPADDGKKLLTVIKNNLAAPAPMLAYAIEPVGKSSRVVWHGPVEGLDSDPVEEAEQQGKKTVLEEAKKLLLTALKEGGKSAKELLQEAENAGIGSRTLSNAKAVLHVVSKRKTDPAGKSYWEWRLPKV